MYKIDASFVIYIYILTKFIIIFLITEYSIDGAFFFIKKKNILKLQLYMGCYRTIAKSQQQK